MKKERKMQRMKQKIKEEKAITLIALVITIIVLLILAAVSIAMLTGENGILTQAKNAKQNTTVAGEKEQLQLAYLEAKASKLEKGDKTAVTAKELEDQLKNDQVNATVTEDSNPIEVEFNDTHNKYTINEATGQVTGPTNTPGGNPPPPAGSTVVPGTPATETAKDNYTDSNKKSATIPKGFTVSETDNEIDTGLVIIAPDGSEFVWVPVEKAIAEDETTGGETKSMAVKDSTDDNYYRGILYNFEETGSSVISGCTTTNFNNVDSDDSYREPAYLTNSSYADASSYNQGRVTEAGLKNEYKAMIESVEEYGGFYVGRYETSINGDTVASKKTTPMTTMDNNSQMWYGMYEKQKNYASANSIQDIVGSSMIWGSQYDAMLNWILKGNDASKVTAKSEKYQGKTGISTDIMNKIYDLGNNLREWTLEANNTERRVLRGGYYGVTDSPSYRTYAKPYYTNWRHWISPHALYYVVLGAGRRN